jgi:hypothetical protein
VLQTPAPHKLDVWLPRLSNIAQVVLLGLTAGAFYLTVLPLYQKALLDEAFARKEIELKQVTATLDAKYAKLREVAIRAFVINADADCSGFTTMMRRTRDRTYSGHSTFDIDVKKCLLDHEEKAPSLLSCGHPTVSSSELRWQSLQIRLPSFSPTPQLVMLVRKPALTPAISMHTPTKGNSRPS